MDGLRVSLAGWRTTQSGLLPFLQQQSHCRQFTLIAAFGRSILVFQSLARIRTGADLLYSLVTIRSSFIREPGVSRRGQSSFSWKRWSGRLSRAATAHPREGEDPLDLNCTIDDGELFPTPPVHADAANYEQLHIPCASATHEDRNKNTKCKEPTHEAKC